VDEVAEREQVRTQLAIQQDQQQAGERNYYEIFQDVWLKRRLRIIIAALAFGWGVRQIIPASSWERIAGAPP
jgi:hypothetical protein